MAKNFPNSFPKTVATLTHEANKRKAQLRSTTTNISEMPALALRQLLSSVVCRVIVDMEPKDVKIQLALPHPNIFFWRLIRQQCEASNGR